MQGPTFKVPGCAAANRCTAGRNFTHAIPTLDNKTQKSNVKTHSRLSLRLFEPVLHLAGSSIPWPIRAPTPRDARAFPVLPMCRAVFYEWTASSTRSAPPHARLFVFIVCARPPLPQALRQLSGGGL